MHTREMISTSPQVTAGANVALSKCIEACYDCAPACTACADACLGEYEVQHLVDCIRLNLDCADICAATGRIATRRTAADAQTLAELLTYCEELCRRCGAECRRHADMHEHCKICAEACSICERACHEAAAATA